MYPGYTDREIAEDLAQYFNEISQEFEPLPGLDEEIRNTPRNPPEPYEIASKLKSIKKPNSVVYGDISPVLIGPCFG